MVVSLQNKKSRAPRLKSFQGLHFPCGLFPLVYYAFLKQNFKQNINFEAKYDQQRDKHFFALNFTL
jgi:hypothetical protein